jgi:hypothetical protein
LGARGERPGRGRSTYREMNSRRHITPPQDQVRFYDREPSGRSCDARVDFIS